MDNHEVDPDRQTVKDIEHLSFIKDQFTIYHIPHEA